MTTPDLAVSDADMLAAAGEDLALYTSLLYPTFRMGAHHQRIVEALEDVAAGRCNRLIICMPPRHGKSLLASEHFPAWYLGRNPSRYVIAATYAQALADDFGRKVRNQIDDPLFGQIFPDVRLAADSASAKKFNTPQGGAYMAVGRNASITGRGAHLLLIDDPIKNMAEADSQQIRATIQAFYTSTAYTRLMPDGAIVVIQTRWRDDDLAGWLLKYQAHEKWRLLDLPAIDMQGRALWPSDYPIEALKRIRRVLTPREWGALYQQRPYAEEGAIIKRTWWRPWTEPRPKHPDMIIISADTAYTTSEANDATGITIWYVTPDDTERSCALLVGALRERLEFPDLIDALLDAVATFGVPRVTVRVLIENKANGLSVIQELRRRAPELSVFQAPAQGDKVARAHSVTAMFQHEEGCANPDDDRTGRVYALARLERDGDNATDVPVFRPWAQMVIDECAAFPLGKHDDLVDSTTHALRHMRTIGLEFFAEDEPPPPPRTARKALY